MKLTPTLTTALAIAALIIPAAAAQAKPADMHASTAIAAAQAREKAQPKQDLRSPDARDAANGIVTKSQDLRSADARDAAIHPRGPGHPVNAPGATAVGSQSVKPAPVAQAPTWPVDPKPVTSAPAAKPATGGDGGVDWTTIAIGIAGSLLAVGLLAFVLNRRQTPRLRATV
jgi:hypothetical protein